MQKERITQSSGITLLIIKESIQSFLKHNHFEMSAAMATYGFFCIIPLLVFVSYLLGNYAILSQTVTRGIENLIRHLFPFLDTFVLEDFLFSTQNEMTWGVVTLGFIFISVMSLTDSLRTAFLKIFNIDSGLSFLRTQYRNALAALTILTIFFFLAVAETIYPYLVRGIIRDSRFLVIFNLFVFLLVAMLCMMIFYKVVLPVKLNIRPLLTASFVSVILISGMRALFSTFLHSHPDYGQAFGSLRMLFIVIIWLYYCFLVTLFGAEIMVNFRKRDALLLKGIFLGDVDFSDVPKSLIRKFIKRYQTGDVIFREGERGNDMSYVLSGAVNIWKKDQVIRTMKKDDYFGEMSMLVDTPRTATAIASEPDTQLVGISRDNFDVILRENPKIVLAILKEMTLRLKVTGENI